MGEDGVGLKGWLFVFEGIDGSGKTTQVKRAAEVLRGRGLSVVDLLEPTHGRFGLQIRSLGQTLSKSRRQPSVEQQKELLELFIRDRMEDVEKNIRPALERGDIVLLDRYYFSTMAYQGAWGIDPEQIRQRNEQFAPRPDLVFYFALPVESARVRFQTAPEPADLFEHLGGEPQVQGARDLSRSGKLFEGRDYLRQVKAIYDDMAQRLPYFHILDATADEKTITRQIIQAIDSLMAAPREGGAT